MARALTETMDLPSVNGRNVAGVETNADTARRRINSLRFRCTIDFG